MRLLIAAAAALLAVGTAVPTFAAPVATTDMMILSTVPTSLTSAQDADPSAASTDTATTTTKKTTKKKKKSTGSTSESASITDIGAAKRGKSDLEIKATVAKSGRQCKLSVKWKDGTNTDAETESKDDKVCTFTIAVPNTTAVVGEATANLTIKDSAGKKVASTSKTFTVK